MTTYTKETILDLLNKSDKAVCRAVVAIWKRQTADEQQAQATAHKNGIGFAAFDAEILSSFAEQYNKRGSLSEKQIALARKRIVHYWRQLVEIANTPAEVTTADLGQLAAQARIDQLEEQATNARELQSLSMATGDADAFGRLERELTAIYAELDTLRQAPAPASAEASASAPYYIPEARAYARTRRIIRH